MSDSALVCARASSIAFTAMAMALEITSVGLVVWMALRAMSLSGIPRREGLAAQDVGQNRSSGGI